jgi:hypothetical protein
MGHLAGLSNSNSSNKSGEKRSLNWWIYCPLFLVSFIFLAAAMPHSVEVYDEGLILTGASRVLAGELPHRDFYTNYGPGQFYAVAAFYKLFGQSVLAERFLDILVKAGIVCLVFSLSLEVMGRKSAGIATLVTFLWIAALGAPGYPIWASMLVMLIAVKTIFPVIEGRRSTASLVISGVFVGVIALFRYDVGFFVCAAMSGVLAAYSLSENSALNSRAARILSAIAPFWIGIAAVCMPLFIVFAASGAIPDFIFQIIQFPAKFYARTRSLPLPLIGHPLRDLINRGHDIVIYVPPLAILTAIAFLAVPRQPRAAHLNALPRNWTWKIALLSSLAFALYFKGIVRGTGLHMALSLVPSFLVLVAVAWRLSSDVAARPAQRIAHMLAALSLAWMVAISSFAVFAVARLIGESVSAVRTGELSRLPRPTDSPLGSEGSCIQPSEFERTRCFRIENTAAQAVYFIRQKTAETEPIFVGTGRHDKIFWNDIEFYFIANRRPATKWYQFDPGLQTSQAIQENIVAELKREDVKYIVLWSKADDSLEENQSSISSGVFVLDNYIKANYKVVKSFGFYSILTKHSYDEPWRHVS